MLETYRKKRDFTKTAEPSSSEPSEAKDALRFVVQKHAASHLHYDFRLEADGVLKSWAVPKGPSLNPKDKHLAVMVEDHPLGYATFEGVIPKGEYGGGQVVVWDEGEYQPKGTQTRTEAESAVLEGIEHGKLHFTLFGKKLHGEFVLARIHGDEEKNWLLMKVHDEFSSEASVLDEEASVRTGRTIEDLKGGARAVATPKTTFSPMLASEATKPFDDPDWEFELKLDGVRAIATKQDGTVSLLSRNGNSVGENLPKIMEALQMSAQSFVLDGELVFFDEDGKPSFQQLMQRIRPERSIGGRVEPRSGRIEYCVFDVLRLEGEDLTKKPLRERQAVLESMKLSGPWLRRVDSFPEHGKLLYDRATEMGFEGIMAKKLSSKYEQGRRSPSWLKIKNFHSEEFAICGYTAGKGARSDSFGAFVLGQRNQGGELEYSGNVGGGFSDSDLEGLRRQLDTLKVATSPFAAKVDIKDHVVWVEPKLIAEVKFMSRTEDHRLRFPVFLRLRPDRDAPTFVAKSEGVEEAIGMPDEVLAQLDALDDSGEITIGSRSLKVTHLSKVLWPKTKSTPEVTKRDLLRYYAAVSPEMLPFLKDRPISFVRHPDGIAAPGFFQKHPLPGMPEFVTCVKIWTEHSEKVLDWIVCNDLETLLWLGQVGSVEIHPWYSRTTSGTDPKLSSEFGSLKDLEDSVLDYPDFIVFDLDPNIKGSAKELGSARSFDPEAWKRTAKIALALRELLSSIELESWVKSSGKTGIHVFVPIERRYHYDQVKAMAETLGKQLEKDFPEDVTMVWSVKKRPSAVFVDHNQNVRGKTLACAFSPRVAAGASVSFPLSWDSLSEIDPTSITIQSAPAMLSERGNTWKEILRHPQRLKF